MAGLRPGEVVAEGLKDPDGPRLRVIGRIRTPWGPDDCPRNMGTARQRGGRFVVELDPDLGPALEGLAVGQPVILLYWMDRARRDLLRQSPRHIEGTRGTFALRSPNRPNSIGVATVVITALDPGDATLGIDAIDCYDDTPLIDIKPWTERADLPPGRDG
ncbi:tRNA-Thr(GGU) m(6)t(6)A37 methyltransferase TsaA [Rhodovulum bhavnagarense]|uniref:tRNA-Thr(GGU) m(6)t(6)A37 methyltransferase TsaA n=1 Tax=Rhodovulum bhavnagarense TaxID=992286 RepID=A0A4R2R9P6_9RHOB|nr:TrmO family methyltransferase [Rhodovulum bhavnagarense]TCP58687.1 tRNA-Thr(GGU) m(6)t(6)A37 methyltransferase TsaA [Rhodovulum bhavnagarense]